MFYYRPSRHVCVNKTLYAADFATLLLGNKSNNITKINYNNKNLDHISTSLSKVAITKELRSKILKCRH